MARARSARIAVGTHHGNHGTCRRRACTIAAWPAHVRGHVGAERMHLRAPEPLERGGDDEGLRRGRPGREHPAEAGRGERQLALLVGHRDPYVERAVPPVDDGRAGGFRARPRVISGSIVAAISSNRPTVRPPTTCPTRRRARGPARRPGTRSDRRRGAGAGHGETDLRRLVLPREHVQHRRVDLREPRDGPVDGDVEVVDQRALVHHGHRRRRGWTPGSTLSSSGSASTRTPSSAPRAAARSAEAARRPAGSAEAVGPALGAASA